MPGATSAFPQPPPLTANDLTECRWDAILPDDPQLDLTKCLEDAASDADRSDRVREAAALRLLADACSMMLDADNPTQPFQPWWTDPDGRSNKPTLDSFGPCDIALFADIAADIPHHELRARLADIVRSREPSRGLQFADLAIEAYLFAPLDKQGWNLGGRDAWHRATQLAISLQRVELACVIEQRLLDAFWRAERPDGALPGSFASLLFERRLASDQHPMIAERLVELAGQLSANVRFREARELLAVAAGWFRSKGPAERNAKVLASIAQSWCDEARKLLAEPSPSAIAAGDFLEKAIQVYRTVNRKYRPALGIDERLEALQRERLELGERSLAELGMVQITPTDISALVRDSVSRVTGQDEIMALHGLATLWRDPCVETEEQDARETMRRSRYAQLLHRGTTMASDGRVISKVGGRSPEEDEARALQVQMLQHFRIAVGLAAQGAILPALAHMAVEHPLNLNTFVTLTQNSHLVPPDHARRVGRALYFGYTRDFETALQYLAPEMENIVRYHLKHSGAVTINTAADGLQTELGLSRLVRMPQMETVFGKDLSFEINALFCDQDGFNLRNDVAHGLISDHIGCTAESVYAWWLVFRLVFRSSPYAATSEKRGRQSEQE